MKPIDVVILSGGLGTRFRPVISDTQKTMARVKDKPFLEHLIAHYKNAGLNRFIICAGYKHKDIRNYFEAGSQWNITITYSIESKKRGTAGAIKQAEKMITSEDFFVLNGDTFLAIDPLDVINFHQKEQVDGTICLREFKDIREKGEVIVDNKNRIVGFLEKQPEHRPGLINGGVYILKKEVLRSIPKDGEVSLEKDIFPAAIKKHKFIGYKTSAFFIDIGSPEEYLRSQQVLPI